MMIELVLPLAKELSEAKGEPWSALNPQRECGPAYNLISYFWPPELLNRFLLFK
jgi:hypothetical protein